MQQGNDKKAKFFPLFYKPCHGTAQDDAPVRSATEIPAKLHSKSAARNSVGQADSHSASTKRLSRASSKQNLLPMRIAEVTRRNSPAPPLAASGNSSIIAPLRDGTKTSVDEAGHLRPVTEHRGTTSMPPLGTRDTPIEIPDSPENCKRRVTLFDVQQTTGTTRGKKETLLPPWPNSELQHNRGKQDTPQLRTTKADARIPCSPSNATRSTLKDFLLAYKASGGDVDLPAHLPILIEQPQLPASFDPSYPHTHSARPFDSSSGYSWTEFYRPTSADDVLGNEHHACYLRAWLEALRLQLSSEDGPDQLSSRSGPKLKRPSVVRSVNPKRKRRRLSEDDVDDWIVNDDEDEDPGPVDTRSDEEYEPAQVLPLGQADSISGNFSFTPLTNVIVLAGPSGVGKSAAAHACAAELGWSVFEIYPGIGKRSGSNIMSLVGDAARNHHLRIGKPSDSISHESTRQVSPLEPRDQTVDHQTIRQSVFLFDEVDILFREDTNFWPTVVELVAGSRRPVILTCNDISLLPLHELPIQAVLEFRAPKADAASKYLQQLAALNGLHLDQRVALAFYNHEQTTRQEGPRGDLRQSINSLQFWASTAPWSDSGTWDMDELAARWDDEPAPLFRTLSLTTRESAADDLRSLWRLVDCVSSSQYSPNRLNMSIELAEQPQQEDDVAGQTELPINDTLDRLAGSGFLDRVQSLKAAALRASRREYERTGAGGRARGAVQPSSARTDAQTLAAGQRWHQSQQAALVRDVVPTCMLRPTSREIVLDYLPRIVEMVRADDRLERERAPAGETGGSGGGGRRRTRRQRQMEYERYVTLGEEAAVAARAAGTWAES